MEDLKIIKKYYGEKMMHLCRELFPTILEKPLRLSKILLSRFEPQKFLYEDIVNNNLVNEFKNFIYDEFNKKSSGVNNTDKTPKELLEEAGYILYECRTQEEVQNFRKYYHPKEELCTFKDDRLERCFVFFAVKKDVDEIRREDFIHPQRQDRYGTSVISIQFTRDSHHTLSIKNRYNHTVINPDATFSNNLDNIIPGLTESFERYYGLKQDNKNSFFEIPGYTRANDGRYYKYNMEINNVYYCPNNIIIDNFEVKRYPKEKYIIMDYFIFDLVSGIVSLYDEQISDSFSYSIIGIKKIEISKDEENKIITLTPNEGENIIIKLNKYEEIVGLINQNIITSGIGFLRYNRKLKELRLDNLRIMEDYFLFDNDSLEKVNFPNLISVGNDCLYYNEVLKEFIAPILEIIENFFLYNNLEMEEINLPSVRFIGNCFLKGNEDLFSVEFPKLKVVKNDFLRNNKGLKIISFESLKKIGNWFISKNKNLLAINIPNVVEIGNNFLFYNILLEEADFSNLQNIGDFFLNNNESMRELIMPKVKHIGKFFLSKNHYLERIDFPELEESGEYFLGVIPEQCEIHAPKYKTYTLKI